MKKEKPEMTPFELELMQVLWQKGPSTARQVQEYLSQDKKRAYTTVITMLQLMENKGLLRHTREPHLGKAFLFHPVVKPEQAQKSALKSILRNYFENDPLSVFATLVQTQKLKKDDIEQMKQMLDELVPK
jgi:predicted transcriptional regulator